MTPGHAVKGVAVAFERRGRLVWLRYVVDVPETCIDLPHPAEPVRTDELWRSTCFEAFLRPEDGFAYTEHNFAPSSQWAAYEFDSYRNAMRALQLDQSPQIRLEAASSWFAAEVEAQLQPAYDHQSLNLALSAIIEESDGTKSYWALRHPPGAPDFHHHDCFALTLEAPDPP